MKNNAKLNILLRAYFFGGLVIVTILTILVSIADPASAKRQSLVEWSILGLMIGVVPMLLSFEGALINMGWLKINKPKVSSSELYRPSITYVLVKAIVIALFCNIVAALSIILLYGDQTYSELVIENVYLFVVVIVAVAALLTLWVERTRVGSMDEKSHRVKF